MKNWLNVIWLNVGFMDVKCELLIFRFVYLNLGFMVVNYL